MYNGVMIKMEKLIKSSLKLECALLLEVLPAFT